MISIAGYLPGMEAGEMPKWEYCVVTHDADRKTGPALDRAVIL
jgi:hypothetical protein